MAAWVLHALSLLPHFYDESHEFSRKLLGNISKPLISPSHDALHLLCSMLVERLPLPPPPPPGKYGAIGQIKGQKGSSNAKQRAQGHAAAEGQGRSLQEAGLVQTLRPFPLLSEMVCPADPARRALASEEYPCPHPKRGGRAVPGVPSMRSCPRDRGEQ